MYYYLHGMVTMHLPDGIVVECHGVGYDCLVAHPDEFPVGENQFVFVSLYTYGTDQKLIGFQTLEEKNLYEALINVQGIGPKTALAILAGTSVGNLKAAIDKGDVTYLMRIPGVGRKNATQIILDLRGKLSEPMLAGNEKDRNLEFAKDALRSMGFKEGEIKEACDKIEERGLSAEEYLKRALRNLS